MKNIAATWMELEILILSEVRQKEKHKYHITYIWNIMYGTNESFHRKKKKLMDLENRLVVGKGEEEGLGWTGSFGLIKHKLFHLEWISNEIVLYSTANYI